MPSQGNSRRNSTGAKDFIYDDTYDEYREWIALIKAFIKVNRELLELYWHIGADIVNRQKRI